MENKNPRLGISIKDPRLDKTIEGKFCKKISVQEVVEKYGNEIYEISDEPEKYNKINSSEKKGLILLGKEGFKENIFVLSFYKSDPFYLELVNAFELFKKLKFGYLDDYEDLSILDYNETPSYKAALKEAAEILNKKEAVKK